MADAARRAGVPIVTGDTKVVEHGRADGMYISTTGLGLVDARADLRTERVEPGDRVLLSGPIGNHGMAIMLARAELDIEADIRSDTRPLDGPGRRPDRARRRRPSSGCAMPPGAAWPRCSTNWPAMPT